MINGKEPKMFGEWRPEEGEPSETSQSDERTEPAREKTRAKNEVTEQQAIETEDHDAVE